MSKETTVPVGEVLSRDEFDRDTIETLRRRALATRKDREAIEQLAASLPEESGAAARRKRGVALAALGRHEEAAAVLEAAGRSTAERLLLGECYRELGRFEEAASLLRQLSPNGASRFEIDMALAGTAAAAGDYDEALKILKRNRKEGQGQPEYHFRLGCALEAAGDSEAAFEAFQAGLERGEHPGAAFRLGRLADRLGNEDAARDSYERCLSGAALYVNALLNLGLLCEDINDFARATDCYTRALRLDPTNGRAMMFLKDAEASTSMYIDEELMRRVDRRNQVLETPITDFELSVRSRNCLRKMGVRALGDLAQCTEAELLTYKNFGETSLREIRNLLSSKGLRLGMGREAEVRAETVGEPPSQADAELLGRAIDDMELSVRGRNCLQRLEIRTVDDLVQCTEAELLATKNFGQTSLSEIKIKLTEWGLSLREP